MSRAPKPPEAEAPPESPEFWSTPSGRLALRLDDLAERLGVSRRTLERVRSAGRFPPPDLHIGKMPLWKPETIRAWVDGGGGR